METLYEWNNELMTEHLTYPPLSLIDDVINTINTLLYKAVGAIEQYMKHLPPSMISEKEINEGVQQVETFLENAIDRNFDAFELYALRNIFMVPENIRGWIKLRHQMVGLICYVFFIHLFRTLIFLSLNKILKKSSLKFLF